MTPNNRRPELTRRKALASIAVGVIALPAAVQQLTEQDVAAEAAIDTATLPAIDTKPFLITF